jgi:hypothetical protein
VIRQTIWRPYMGISDDLQEATGVLQIRWVAICLVPIFMGPTIDVGQLRSAKQRLQMPAAAAQGN